MKISKNHAVPFLITALFILASITAGCGLSGSKFTGAAKKDLRELPGNLWQDSKDYVSNNENIALLLLGGGASAYVRHEHDDQIEDHFQGHHTFSRDMTIGMGAIPMAELLLTGTGYLYGSATENDELYKVSRAMLEAQALNGIYTSSLKLIAQDKSPNGEWYAWPSGHTSVTVTFATVMNEFYGPWVGMPLYGLSGLVMYERMETGEHWASDLVFGAVLGYTVGKTVAGNHKPQVFGMDIMPYVDPYTESSGVILGKRF